MESLRRQTKNIKDGSFRLFSATFGQGACTFPNYRWIIGFLGLLNVVLFISAAVLGIKCAKVKEGSIHVSHSSVSQLISEIDDLRSNHNDVIEAEEKAKMALERAIKNHTRLKEQIEHQKTINDEHQRKVAALQVEKANLRSNVSALEGTCGKCPPGWILLNSSCYFFSYTESTTIKKDWPDSRDDCKRRGSDLVVIDNQVEQEFVSNNIENKNTSSSHWENGFWVGLTDTESEGKWVWINHVTELEPRYWMDGEPNNHGRQGEDCAVVVYSPFNPWKTRYDGQCHGFKLHWICEMPSK